MFYILVKPYLALGIHDLHIHMVHTRMCILLLSVQLCHFNNYVSHITYIRVVRITRCVSCNCMCRRAPVTTISNLDYVDSSSHMIYKDYMRRSHCGHSCHILPFQSIL